VSFPNDLLEQARHLANREPRRPKQASLRRAVSTAYYALFHLLSIETAKNWKRPAERITLARMLEKIKSVEAAFRSWKEIRGEPEAQNFLLTLLLKERRS
jgi:hypothetical protein